MVLLVTACVSLLIAIGFGFVYHRFKVQELKELIKDKDAKYHSMVEYIKALSPEKKTAKSKQPKNQK